MGRGLLSFEVWARLWLVLVLCRLCVACLSGNINIKDRHDTCLTQHAGRTRTRLGKKQAARE